MFTRLLATSMMVALLSAPAFAQGPQPMQPAKPAPAASTPSPAKPATTGAATAPAAVKINLNTATEAELDKLPHVGSHRSKAIIASRPRRSSRTGMISWRARSFQPTSPQPSRTP